MPIAGSVCVMGRGLTTLANEGKDHDAHVSASASELRMKTFKAMRITRFAARRFRA